MSILKVNTIQDKGGNTIISSDGSGTFTPNGFGKIGQVKSSILTTGTSTTGTTYLDTGLSATITPSSTSSKILIIAQINVRITSDNHIRIRLLRDSTEIEENVNFFFSQGTNIKGIAGSFLYLDSPSSTSELTYKFQYRSRDSGETVSVSESGTPSTIIIQEVLA